MFEVYWGGGTVEERIKAAVGAFWKREGRLPAGVVVNEEEVEAAQAAREGLGLPAGMGVEGSGGCLVTEVWVRADTGKGE